MKGLGVYKLYSKKLWEHKKLMNSKAQAVWPLVVNWHMQTSNRLSLNCHCQPKYQIIIHKERPLKDFIRRKMIECIYNSYYDNRNIYLLVLSTWKVNIVGHNRVVDTFRHSEEVTLWIKRHMKILSNQTFNLITSNSTTSKTIVRNTTQKYRSGIAFSRCSSQ